MFISDKLVYIQMPKTGCTHIESLLNLLLNGEIVGKHNPANEELIVSGRYFISSIRNPWEWYLSQWAYGVQGQGGVVKRLTQRQPGRHIKALLRNPWRATFLFKAILDELTKDVSSWRQAYRDSSDVTNFRKWLKLIHASDSGRYYVKQRDFNLTKHWGFMTYEYLSLCCRDFTNFRVSNEVSDYETIRQFDIENCYIDYFVRQEALEAMLCSALEKIRPLSEEEKKLVFSSGKTNISSHSRPIAEYYDAESINLVMRRDRLLVEKFGYSPPT